MPDIDIHHPHTLPMDQARAQVESISAKLQERFGVECSWGEDTLHFNRAGVDGHLHLKPEELHLTARLGFLFSAMRGPLETEVRRVLDLHFPR